MKNNINDSIVNYGKKKSKGYESLPRELLQSTEITLEAIGLLASMQSYPDNWVLRKSNVRSRYKNGWRSVERAWDELVEHGYILQFRKRVGKIWAYSYLFDVDKFSAEDIQEIAVAKFQEGMILYHKGIKDYKTVNLYDYVFLSDEEKAKLNFSFWQNDSNEEKPKQDDLDLSSLEEAEDHSTDGSEFWTYQNDKSNFNGSEIWDYQNGKSKKDDQINDSWTYQYGHSNMDFPNWSANKLINKEIDYKEINQLKKKEDEEEINKKEQVEKSEMENAKVETKSELESEKESLFFNLINTNNDFKAMCKFFVESGIPLDLIMAIVLELNERPYLMIPEIIKQQVIWMMHKSTTDGIGDFLTYFFNGLERRYKGWSVDVAYDSEFAKPAPLLDQEGNPVKITMHNWLEGE